MENIEQHEKPVKRPVFLLVLCILTYVYAGFSILGVLVSLISGPLSESEMQTAIADSANAMGSLNGGNSEFAETMAVILRMSEYINSNFYVHYLITMFSLLIGLAGAVLMYRGNKKGFHLYIIYSILNSCLVYVSVPVNEVPNFLLITNLVVSGLFVFLYSRNLHWMK